jgi:hypothetical protein
MVRYAQDSGKINFFREIFAIMTSLRVFGFLEKGSYGGDTATPRSVLEHNSQQ